MSLPQAHRNGSAMANVLTQYIADPLRVRRIVSREFGDAPALSTIANMRARHQRAAPAAINHTWEIDRREQEMEKANKRFLAALRAERRA